MLPPQNLATSASFTLPEKAVLKSIAGIALAAGGAALAVKLGGVHGAFLVNLAGGAQDSPLLFPLDIPLPAGAVLYNAGDAVTLIFG
jgi:hypothetical protein